MPWPAPPTSRSAVDLDPLEVHLAHGVAVQAHLLLGRAERDALGVARHDEAGQPAGAVVGGADEGRVEVGVAGVRDPGLGALERVCRGVGVVVGRRPGAHRGDVGAGAALGQAVGAELVAGEHRREQGLLLRVGAELGHGVAGEGVDRDADGDAHPGRGDLLDDLEVDLVGLAAAAELLGVGQRQQAGAAERAEGVDAAGPGSWPRARSASSTRGRSSLSQISRVRSMRS